MYFLLKCTLLISINYHNNACTVALFIAPVGINLFLLVVIATAATTAALLIGGESTNRIVRSCVLFEREGHGLYGLHHRYGTEVEQ